MAGVGLREAIDALGGHNPLARAIMDAIGVGIDFTPTENEVFSEGHAQDSWFAFGEVTQCLDEEHSGRLLVKSQAFSDGEQPCDYVSPVGGAGYGFFALPGIGAKVLVGKAPYSDFWMGCLYAPDTVQVPGTKTQPYSLAVPSIDFPKHEIDDMGTLPNDIITSYGIPNENSVYQDNNLPDSFILKHPAGHSISLTHKDTSDRIIDEIKLKTAGNKRLIMSDAPAIAGGEAIRLIDENDNGIKIQSLASANPPKGDAGPDSISTVAKGNVQVQTKEGHIQHVVAATSKGGYSIDVAGQGDMIVETGHGEIILNAQKAITLQCGSSKIIMTQDGIRIESSRVTIEGDFGEVDLAGHTLTKHIHIDTVPMSSNPTSTPQG